MCFLASFQLSPHSHCSLSSLPNHICALINTPTHTNTYCMCTHTHRQTHSELSIPVTNKHKHIKSASLSPHKRARTNTPALWMSTVESKHGPMKNACPFACFIRNTHRDSIPIPAEIPHRNINYTGNLGGSVGRNGAQQDYGIYSVVSMRGSGTDIPG